MKGVEVAFRPCEPQDVESAVPLIYSSGPVAFNYAFCDRKENEAQEFLRSAFVQGKTEFGFQQHTAVIHNNQLIGIGAVRHAKQNFKFTLTIAQTILGFYGPLGGMRTIVRGLRTEHVIQPPKSKIGILYHLGVAPAYQSQGVGEQLIHELFTQIQALNLPTAALDVAATNPRAQALYERLGFTAVKTRQGGIQSRFGEIVDHVYMERPLSPA